MNNVFFSEKHQGYVRENTLDVTQVASNVYNLSITIDEVA